MSQNQENQINELNSITKAEIGVSKISGVGVIAVTVIKKGEKIYADKLPCVYTLSYGQLNRLFPYVREIILKRWASIINGSKFIYPDARLVSFMNHGEGAWANYDPKTDTAIRDISVGEEILEDYTKMPNYEKVWPLNKNPWLTAIPVTKNQSKTSFSVVRLVKRLIKNFASN